MISYSIEAYSNGIRHAGLSSIGYTEYTRYKRQLSEIARKHDLVLDYADEDVTTYRRGHLTVIGKRIEEV
jgi:hypothetical protein